MNGGDGVGPEVVAEAVKVLRAVATDTAIETTGYDLGARRWLRTGETLGGQIYAGDRRRHSGARSRLSCEC